MKPVIDPERAAQHFPRYIWPEKLRGSTCDSRREMVDNKRVGFGACEGRCGDMFFDVIYFCCYAYVAFLGVVSAGKPALVCTMTSSSLRSIHKLRRQIVQLFSQCSLRTLASVRVVSAPNQYHYLQALNLRLDNQLRALGPL